MKRERRLDAKLLIPKCPDGFAIVKTRPPLLSSATRLAKPGLPGCARLAGANAQPPYGNHTFSYSYSSRIHSSIPGPGSKNNQFGWEYTSPL
jgi:hypothetical protein